MYQLLNELPIAVVTRKKAGSVSKCKVPPRYAYQNSAVELTSMLTKRLSLPANTFAFTLKSITMTRDDGSRATLEQWRQEDHHWFLRIKPTMGEYFVSLCIFMAQESVNTRVAAHGSMRA